MFQSLSSLYQTIVILDDGSNGVHTHCHDYRNCLHPDNEAHRQRRAQIWSLPVTRNKVHDGIRCGEIRGPSAKSLPYSGLTI